MAYVAASKPLTSQNVSQLFGVGIFRIFWYSELKKMAVTLYDISEV